MIIDPEIAYIYIYAQNVKVRVCVGRSSDGWFHCTCGNKVDTVAALQEHANESKGKDHPLSFYQSFIGSVGH